MLYKYLILQQLADGRWTGWEQWTECSKTCDGGVRTRTQACIYNDFASKGKNCTEDDTIQEEMCNDNKCYVEPGTLTY